MKKRILATPTKAMPGTPEKVRVMIWRRANGFLIFHPQDAKMDQFREARRPIVSMTPEGDFSQSCNGRIIGWTQVEDGPDQRELSASEDYWPKERPHLWE